MREAKDIRILVVEDEPGFREAMVYEFKRKGFQVTSAANGKQAFAQFQADPSDVVLTDVCMPGGDGIELLDKIKEQSPDLCVVMLVTGFADITSDSAYHKGAEAVFSKPFDRKTLVTTVMRLTSPKEQRWAVEPDNIDTDLKISLSFVGDPKSIETHVISVGRGGMFVTMTKNFPEVNDLVKFKIAWKKDEPVIEGSGIVRWVRVGSGGNLSPGCGIEFTYLTEFCKQRIIELIDEQRPRPFIPQK